MLALTVALILSQAQPAVRRSTPLADDPGMVVRQAGPISVSGISPMLDGGVIGSVLQGAGLTDGGSWAVTCISGCSGSGGSGWVPDGGNIGSVSVTNTVNVNILDSGVLHVSGNWWTGPDGGSLGYIQAEAVTLSTFGGFPSAVAHDGGVFTFDDTGALYIRGPVTTNQSLFSDTFNGPLNVTGTGTATFTNGSRVVTGSGTTFTTLNAGGVQYIKLAADLVDEYVPVERIVSNTQVLLTKPYQGTSGSGAFEVTNWGQFIAPGGSITVPDGGSAVSMVTGLNAGDVTIAAREVGFERTTSVARFALSSRQANQGVALGFLDVLGVSPPNQLAAFVFNGTDPTAVTCTTGLYLTPQTTTNVTIPNGGTTATEHTYEVQANSDATVFYIDDVLVARHEYEIPGPYTNLLYGVLMFNTGPLVASSTATLSWAHIESQNNFVATVYSTEAERLQTKATQGPGQDGGAWNVSVNNGVNNPLYVVILDGGTGGGSGGTVNQGVGQDGGLWGVSVVSTNVVDTNNSTFAPLGAGATFTGTGTDVTSFSQVSVFVYSDRASATNGLKVQFSANNVNWYDSQNHTLTAATVFPISFPVVSKFARVVFTNGALAQTTFTLQTILKPIPANGTVTNLNDVPTALDQGLVTQSLIFGETTGGGGGYRSVKVNPSGALTVAASQDTSPWVVSAASLPLPTGAATAANQTTLNAQTTKLNDGTDTALITAAGALVVDGSGSTQPVSGTVTANAGTGTFAPNVAQVGGVATSTGNGVSGRGVQRVTIASDSTGTVAVTQATAANLNATVVQSTAANLRAQTASEGTTGSAVPAIGSAAGFSDGTNLRIPRVFDTDTSGGTQYTLGANIIVPNSGGGTQVTSASTDTGSVGLATWRIAKFVQATSPATTAVSCSTTATAAPATARTNRVTVTFQNPSTNTVSIFLGGSGVTTADGIELLPGASFTDDVEDTPYFCRVAAGTATLRVMEN